MTRIARPISMTDLDFYEGYLVNLVARSMACASESVWTTMPLRRRKRWERRALAVVFELLADKTIVERLPVLVRNLQSRVNEPEGMRHLNQIAIDPEKGGGRPCIRGLRITVSDVLNALASGQTTHQLLADFQGLTEENVRACLEYAAKSVAGDGAPKEPAFDSAAVTQLVELTRQMVNAPTEAAAKALEDLIVKGFYRLPHPRP